MRAPNGDHVSFGEGNAAPPEQRAEQDDSDGPESMFTCRNSKSEHVQEDHAYGHDPSRPVWQGWHAFRRGLATNLHRLGVAGKEIQSILRHVNLSTTMNIYAAQA